MTFELKNIKPCDNKSFERLTKKFEQGGLVGMTPGDSAEIKADAEGMMEFLLDESFLNEVCYVLADGKKTYHLSERAWGVMGSNLGKLNGQIKKVGGAGEGAGVGDLLTALTGEGGGTEKVDVPLDAFFSFTDESKINEMMNNPPPVIDGDYDTDDWIAVGFNMPPEFVAALRAALNDNENKLFRTGVIKTSYYITSNLESLERVMNASNEIKVWLQNKMSEGSPEQQQFFRAQKQNILSLVNRFEKFAYEQRQLAMEWRGHKWMLAVFGPPTAMGVGSAAWYVYKAAKNGKNNNRPSKPSGDSSTGDGKKAGEGAKDSVAEVATAAAVALATAAAFVVAKTWGGRLASLTRWLLTREAVAGAAWAAGVAVSLTTFSAYAGELTEDIKDGKVAAGNVFVDYGTEFNDTFEDAFIEGFEFWNREIF